MNAKAMSELQSLDPSGRASMTPLTISDRDTKEDVATRIHQFMSDDLFMIRVRQLAWDLFRDKKIVDRTEISHSVANLLEESGLRDVIANATVRMLEKSVPTTSRDHPIATSSSSSNGSTSRIRRPHISRRSCDEISGCVREAREAWESGVNEELLAVLAESKREFVIVRPPGSVNRKLEHVVDDPPPIDLLANSPAVGGAGVSTSSPAAPSPQAQQSAPLPQNTQPAAYTPTPTDDLQFLYNSDDVYECLCGLHNPNMKAAHEDRVIGAIKVQVYAPTAAQLCLRFPELNPTITQFGIDDKFSHIGHKLCFARHDEADSMCANNCCPILDARKYLRRGCPPSYRRQLYRAALQLSDDVCAQEQTHFNTLRLECDRLDLVTDDLYLHDVQTVIDDTRFFVFDEELKQIVLCFSRDEWVRSNCMYSIHTPLTQLPPTATSHHLQQPTQALAAYPPCGVQPFSGLAMYFAPLCYLFRDVCALYSVCRAMFARFWCKMNVISADEGTLVPVCKCFEALLVSNHPKLVFHMQSLGIQPLQIAMPWMQLGFVNLLEVDQVLMLWDRLIGYNDALLLAVLAVAIFMIRAENIMQTTSVPEIIKLMSEGSRLRVVPLLQMMLPFADPRVTTLTAAAKSISVNGIAGIAGASQSTSASTGTAGGAGGGIGIAAAGGGAATSAGPSGGSVVSGV